MGVKKTIGILIGMALTGTLGMLLLFLACALPFFSVWWPMFVVVFYLLSPMPLALIRLLKNREWMDEENHVAVEVAYFVSACIVVSAFGKCVCVHTYSTCTCKHTLHSTAHVSL
jgi:hypothetical protein